MKILIALGLLLLGALAAVGVLMQCALFLAFACDGVESGKKFPKWLERLAMVVIATPLLLGIVVPPVLYYMETDWETIRMFALVAFGVPLGIVLAIVMRIVESK